MRMFQLILPLYYNHVQCDERSSRLVNLFEGENNKMSHEQQTAVHAECSRMLKYNIMREKIYKKSKKNVSLHVGEIIYF
jgi:hypothetical protein